MPTQIVPYCHVDPSVFTNTTLGTFECNAAGIANVTSDTQDTGLIVRSFLAGTSDWKSVSGTGDYQATSSSLGTTNCASLAEGVGYFSAARCKIGADIYASGVGPLTSAPGRIVSSGGTITITGYDFGDQCTSCQVLANPVGSTTQTALQVSSWTGTSISAMLPASLTGLLTIIVKATTGTDAITIMAAVPGPTLAGTPSSLQFAYTAGGAVPAAQSIQIANSGSGTLTFAATASQSWLSVSPASGTAPATLTVSVSPAALSAGSYSGTVLITASGASNSPLSVAVTLTVAAPTSTLAVTPQALSFNYTVTVGGTAPAAQSVSITTGGAGALSWTASSSVFWASVSPASASASGTLSVLVNPANLAAGTYTGNLQIAAAAGGSASVSITFVVQGTQPAGTITGVANGGSFQSGFASATWVSIFGTNLSASTENWSTSSFANGLLPTSLDGVSVTINGIPASVTYISPTQINVLAPDDATTGAVQIQVTAAGQKSNSFAAQKQQFAPAFFTFAGGKYVAAEHANYSYLSAPGLIAGVTTTPAQPGEIVLLYGTGFGPTSPALRTANLVTTAEPLTNKVTLTIGGVTANVQFAGLVESGLYQFNVTVPSLPAGDAPVVATIGGVSTQTGVSIMVQQ